MTSKPGRYRLLVAVAVAVAVTAALVAALGLGLRVTNDTSTTPSAGRSPIRTVFVIMMENTDWSAVKGSADFPYVNSLLPRYAHAENYHSAGHPSLPNYVTLEAGDSLGMTDGAYLPTDHPLSETDHLVTQLAAKGVDWRYYAENLPGDGTTCNTSDPGTPYSEDHNAFAYFDDVRDDPAYCIRHERPYGELSSGLAAGTVSGYNFIVPNDWHQGEKLAPGSSCMPCQADDFLKSEVPRIQSASAYRKGGAILILWDEGSGSSSVPSGLVVVSPYAKVGYSSYTDLTHASTLRSMHEIFGVRPFLRAAASAHDLADLFTVPLT